MENENVEEVLEETQEIQEEKPKPELTPEQIKGIKQRQLTKLAKELGYELPKENKSEEKKETKKEGFDYAELAYLSAKGIPDEDVQYVEDMAKNTGKQLRELLSTEWFKKDLKERQEARITKEAIPTGTKRSTVTDKTDKDYWIAKVRDGKAKLSDISDVKLRREVNNAIIQSEDSGNRFASTSVISGQK